MQDFGRFRHTPQLNTQGVQSSSHNSHNVVEQGTAPFSTEVDLPPHQYYAKSSSTHGFALSAGQRPEVTNRSFARQAPAVYGDDAMRARQQQRPASAQSTPADVASAAIAHQGPSKAGNQVQPLDSNQDPFKKWQHYYVNQKNQLNQYKFFHPPEHGEHAGHAESAAASNPLSKSKSGSYIGKPHPDTPVSNVRALDGQRSATPELSSRPVARQLPMRPNSANAKQRMPAVSVGQLKQQKASKIVPPQASKLSSKKAAFDVNRDETLSTISTMSTSSSEVDSNLRRPNSRTPPAFKAALDKFASSGQKSLNEQRGLLRSSPSQSRGGRVQRPRTAPPQRSALTVSASSPAAATVQQQALVTADGGRSLAGGKELSRSCELLNQLARADNETPAARSERAGSARFHCGHGKDAQFASTDLQDSRYNVAAVLGIFVKSANAVLDTISEI